MERDDVNLDEFEQLLQQLFEAGAIGAPPVPSSDGALDKEATLAYTWAALNTLDLASGYVSYQQFAEARGRHFGPTDTPMRAIWRLLTPPQRSAMAAIVTTVRLLGRRGLKRVREGEGENARYATAATFMLTELVPEMQDAITRQLPLRPLMRFLSTDRQRRSMLERYGRALFARDILANLDYTLHDEVDRGLAAIASAFVRRFGANRLHDRFLNPVESAYFKVLLDRTFGQTEVRRRFDYLNYLSFPGGLLNLTVAIPTNVPAFTLYRETMTYVAHQMLAAYNMACSSARHATDAYLIQFSSPRGALFDIRLRAMRYGTAERDVVPFGFRQFRSLTADDEAERLFAPLRDFYASHDPVYPTVAWYSAGESDEESAFDEDVEVATQEARAFLNAVFNLLYGLSPLLTMRREYLPSDPADAAHVAYIALDTRGEWYDADKYARRSTATSLFK